MRQHLNQYVFSPLFWLMSLLIIVLLVLVLALFTPFGPKVIANIADASLKELTIKGVSGSVLTGLHVDELLWQSDEVGVSATAIHLNIDKYDIEKQKAFADNLEVGELSIILNKSRKSSSDAAVVIPDFGLPINVDAKELHLGSLRIVEQLPNQESYSLLFRIEGIVLKQASVNQGQLSFARLQGNPIIIDQPLRINVENGSLNMNQPHQIKTQGEISFNHPELGSLIGAIQVGGTLTEYEVSSDLNFEQKKIGAGSIRIKGEGDYKKIDFEKISIDSVHGKMQVQGNIAWDPKILLSFDIDGNEITTTVLLPEWPVTDVNTQLRYEGSYIDRRYESQIDISSLKGDFKGQAIKGKGRITTRETLLKADDLQIELGDNHLIANGAVSDPMNIRLTLDAKQLSQIVPDSVAGSVKGDITVTGGYNALQVRSELQAQGLAFGEYKQGKQTLYIDSEIGLNNNSLMIKQAHVKLGKNILDLTGSASEPFDLQWDLKANQLTQVLPQVKGRLIGTGKLTGIPKNLNSSFELNANALKYEGFHQSDQPLRLMGDISVKDDQILLKKIRVNSGSNTVKLSGVASDPLDIDLAIEAKKLADVSPDINGQLSGSAKVKGAYNSPLIITNLFGDNIAFKGNKLVGSRVSLQGEVQLQNGIPHVNKLNTQIGSNNFQVSGRASSPFDLRWNIDSKNLKQIHPDFTGGIVAKGKLQGTMDNPIINGEADVNNLKFKDFSLQAAKVSASTQGGVYRIKGVVNNVRSADQGAKLVNVDLNGTIENHQITAVIDHQAAKVNLKANGAWRNPQWQGVVQILKVQDTQAGDWALQKPARVSLSQQGFSAEQFCLRGKEGGFCSTASYIEGSGLTAKGQIQKTTLALFQPFLPEGIRLNGDVTGNYDIKQNNGKPSGTIFLRLPKNSFSVKGEGDEEQTFIYENAELKANINNRIINTQAKMSIIGKGVFSSKAKIKLSPHNGKHTVDGSANFDVPNINFAQRFIPHSRGLRGSLKSKLNFNGLLSKPQIRGEANLRNGYLRLPEAGTEITQITINLSADRPGRALIKGSMKMGTGLLSVNGDMNLKDIAKWQANIKIRGDNIGFLNTNEVRATMSPDITLNLTPDVVKIEGKAIIPMADIRLKTIPETSIDESKDAFVIGESERGEKAQSIKVLPNVLIQLGDNVKMDAFGLAAKLSGDVRVTHNRRDILANGSLRVQDGKFEAYGQDLAISNGRLIFNGPPHLIGMDIRATRTIDKQVVGIHLGGTLLKPKSKIFSDPELEESESLSYLITGNNLSSASGQESALMLSAVRGLGITGNGSIIQKIGASFGLDDVNIVTKSDLKKSELELGKRLGSRLYVRYLVGLFDQTQKIAIEYKINEVLSLEAQTTSDDFGLDFIYEVETD